MAQHRESPETSGTNWTAWRALAAFVSILAGGSLGTTAAYPALVPGFESTHQALWKALFWLGVALFTMPLVAIGAVAMSRRAKERAERRGR